MAVATKLINLQNSYPMLLSEDTILSGITFPQLIKITI